MNRFLLFGLLCLMFTPTTIAAPIYINQWDDATLAFDRGDAVLRYERHDARVKLHGDFELDTLVIEQFEVGRPVVGFSLPPLTLALLPNDNPLLTEKHAWANVGGYDYRFELYPNAPNNIVRFMAIDRTTGRQVFPPTTYASGAMFSHYFGTARSGNAPEPSGLTMIVIALPIITRHIRKRS